MTEPLPQSHSSEEEKFTVGTGSSEENLKNDDENDVSSNDGSKYSGPLPLPDKNDKKSESSEKQSEPNGADDKNNSDNKPKKRTPRRTINRLRQSAQRMGSLVKKADVEAAAKSAANNIQIQQHPQQSSLSTENEQEPLLRKTPQEPCSSAETTSAAAALEEGKPVPLPSATTTTSTATTTTTTTATEDKHSTWLRHIKALKGEFEIQRLETQRVEISTMTTLASGRTLDTSISKTNPLLRNPSWDASVHSEWTAPRAPRNSSSSLRQNSGRFDGFDEHGLLGDAEDYSYIEESVDSFGQEINSTSLLDVSGGRSSVQIPSVLKCDSEDVEVEEEVTEHDDEDEEDHIIIAEETGSEEEVEDDSASGYSSYFESGGSDDEGAEADSVGSGYTLEADSLSCRSDVTLWSDDEGNDETIRATNTDDFHIQRVGGDHYGIEQDDADDEEDESSSSYLDITIHSAHEEPERARSVENV